VSLLLIVSVIVAVVVISAFFIVRYLKYKDGDEDEQIDYTKVEHYMPQFTNGSGGGRLIETLRGSYRDAYIYEYLKKIIKDGKVVGIEKRRVPVFCYPYQVRHLPRYSLSDDFSKIIIYPPTPEDFPEEIKKTEEGKAMMEYIANKKAEMTAIKAIRKERDAEDDALMDTKGKDLFREVSKEQRALFRDAVKTIFEQGNKKPSTFDTSQPDRRY
jgi:hypothetical protein